MEQKTYLEQINGLLFQYGPKVVSALLILFVGLWVIRRISGSVDALVRKRQIDDSLRPFFISLVDVALKVALLLVVAGQVGIETTSFIAVFSAVAFAVGLALQGSLGNFASGVLILLFRPYRVGDLLEVEGHIGCVSEIQIFNTVLITDHAKKIIIPNSKITEGAITNIAKGSEVLAEITVLLDSATSAPALREAVDAAAARCTLLVANRPPEVVITGISRDDMKVDIGWWTLGEHYIGTLDFIHEALRDEFETRSIRLAKERRRDALA
ncbi:MAG: mechanosensitive ion channel [Lewinellaceae bacterium]|nr:mechanosensitive ion channel [Lewinellaceae bacterium]